MLRQPLLHFIVIGLALFGIFEWVRGDTQTSQDPRVVNIDRNSLLTFMQYRSKAFNEAHFSRQLDDMRPDQRQQLIDELVREEVLYREARNLQLDRDDYVIKRRLIQKLEFLTRGFLSSGPGLSEVDIRDYYTDHRQDYYVQPSVTFTHVFFDFERHGREPALNLARQTLVQLNRDEVAFADGIQFGDRFLYHTNYVERTPDYIASHFGMPLAAEVFELPVNEHQWQGPFESSYGMHLFLLVRKEPGRFPEVEEIYDRLREDAEQNSIRARTEQEIAKIIDSYNVRVVLD